MVKRGGVSSYLRLRRLRQLDPPNRHDLQQLPLRRRTIRPRPESLLQPRPQVKKFGKIGRAHKRAEPAKDPEGGRRV